jgi:peptide deformylase
MNQAIKTILTGVITAAIIGLAANTVQVNSRLASIEAQMKILITEKNTNLATK